MIFIAEIGLNHNGNFGLIPEMIRQAAQTGADIAKFQLGWRCGKGEINQLSNDQLKMICDSCDYYGIEPMFSIITEEAYKLAKSYDFKRYKIASRTVIDNPSLIEKILSEGKETFISLGFWEEKNFPFVDYNNVRYLFCISSYPCLPHQIKNFPKTFGEDEYAGYSDHTLGIETALLAISRGAKVVEKHFTLDKSDTTIRDHALSATPDEFSQLVYLGRQIRKTLELGV